MSLGSPKFSLITDDISGLLFTVDTTLDSTNIFKYLVRVIPPSFLTPNDLNKPVLRFPRLLLDKSTKSYCTVYADIDCQYVLYNSDSPTSMLNASNLQMPAFPAITTPDNYTTLLNVQNAPLYPNPQMNSVLSHFIYKEATKGNADTDTENQDQDNESFLEGQYKFPYIVDAIYSKTCTYCYDQYFIREGRMYIIDSTGKRGGKDEDESEIDFPFTNFCVIPISIDCIHNQNGSIEKELRLVVYVSRFEYQEMIVQPNKTEHLLSDIQKIFPQACLEPFVKAANKHLSAYISKMLVDTPSRHMFKRAGWNTLYYPQGQRIVFYSNDLMEQNSVFSTNTGKRLEYLADMTRPHSFYHAVNMLKLSNMTKTLPLFLFSHIGVMFSIFEEAGFAPNFLLNIFGHTGSLKTSVSKVFFKILKDDRNDIASNFNDTATAMEIKMGQTFDEVLLIDDFRPSSNRSETSRMRNTLEKVVRFFGDGIGKGRGNPMLTLKNEFKPHGVCALTGEYLYGVPSSLLRMLIIHVNTGTYNKELLKFYQDNPLVFPTHIRFFIDYLQQKYFQIIEYIKINFPVRREEYRKNNWEARQVQTAVWLDLTADIIFRQYAVDNALTSQQDAERQYQQCKFAISLVVNESNELATHTSSHEMFLLAMVNEIRDQRLFIAEDKRTYNQNPDKCAGFIDQNKRRLYVRPTKAFNAVQQYWDKMDIRFTETERATRQALLVNAYIQGQSEDDKDNTSYVVRLDNSKEVRMLAFYLDKLEREYGSIKPNVMYYGFDI